MNFDHGVKNLQVFLAEAERPFNKQGYVFHTQKIRTKIKAS